MRVLGIDCGGEYTGYGVVEQDDQRLAASSLQRSHSAVAARSRWNFDLRRFAKELTQIIARLLAGAGGHRRCLLRGEC